MTSHMISFVSGKWDAHLIELFKIDAARHGINIQDADRGRGPFVEPPGLHVRL
jgi:hypothetical protein